MVIVDNKKWRTNDGPNQKYGLGGNTKLFLGSSEDNMDEMDQDPNKNVDDIKKHKYGGLWYKDPPVIMSTLS